MEMMRNWRYRGSIEADGVGNILFGDAAATETLFAVFLAISLECINFCEKLSKMTCSMAGSCQF
jgi:hypothetical protein